MKHSVQNSKDTTRIGLPLVEMPKFASSVRKIVLLFVVTFAGLSATQTRAAFVFTLAQSGPNVVITGSGTINLVALTYYQFATGPSPEIIPDNGALYAGPSGQVSATHYYQGFSGPSSWGTGGTILASSGSGDYVGIQPSGDDLLVPSSYISNAFLSDSETFSNTTLSSFGITPGTYTYSWGTGANADTLVVIAVPEPSSLLVCGIGLGFLALWRRWSMLLKGPRMS